MATRTVKLTGIASWVKFKVPDEYGGVKKWKMNLSLDEESYEKFKDQKSMLKVKDTNDGPTISLSKKVEEPKWWDEGKQGAWEAPVVSYNGDDFDDLVGNGSKVEATVQFYDTSMGVGHRLESLKILDLVPYEGKEGTHEGKPHTEASAEGAAKNVTNTEADDNPW